MLPFPDAVMQAVMKSLAGHATLFPIFTSLFLVYTGLLEVCICSGTSISCGLETTAAALMMHDAVSSAASPRHAAYLLAVFLLYVCFVFALCMLCICCHRRHRQTGHLLPCSPPHAGSGTSGCARSGAGSAAHAAGGRLAVLARRQRG